MRNSVISISYPRMDRKLVALGGETISINVMRDDLRTYRKFFVHGGEVISIKINNDYFYEGRKWYGREIRPHHKCVFNYGGGKSGGEPISGHRLSLEKECK